MKRLFTVVGVVALALAESDPFLGTWKLNVAKSKFDPGPPSKSETRTYESTGDGYKVDVERVNADGSKQTYGFSPKYDSKDYPITGQGPNGADTITGYKRIDANTTEATLKKASKVLFTTRRVVSKDGKVLTLSSKGTNANGKPINNVLVYDKQ
jgi:hypothetical protein